MQSFIPGKCIGTTSCLGNSSYSTVFVHHFPIRRDCRDLKVLWKWPRDVTLILCHALVHSLLTGSKVASSMRAGRHQLGLPVRVWTVWLDQRMEKLVFSNWLFKTCDSHLCLERICNTARYNRGTGPIRCKKSKKKKIRMLPYHKCIAVSISGCQSASVSNVFSNNTSKASRRQVTHADCDSGWLSPQD